MRIILLLLLAAGAAGCTQLQADLASVTAGFAKLSAATVSPADVSIAVNLFDGVEATATNYLKLPKCTGGNGPLCRNPAIAAQIYTAIKSGRIARNNLEQFLAGHQTALGVQGDYDALNAAAATLRAVLANYS